nr:hypothetical protein [uncultured Kingella sp.]
MQAKQHQHLPHHPFSGCLIQSDSHPTFLLPNRLCRANPHNLAPQCK